jgi:hypothetical protein
MGGKEGEGEGCGVEKMWDGQSATRKIWWVIIPGRMGHLYGHLWEYEGTC